MKKYLLKQTKKSISLFLAVLMLLSCWVWVAPETADAANTPEEGYYYVEVRGKLDDWDNDENVLRNNWKISTSDGTYTLTSNSIYNGGQNDTTGNYVHASGWVKGFPTGITHEFGQKYTKNWIGIKTYQGDGWGVRDVVVWAGAPGMLAPISDANGGYKTTKAEDSYSGTEITAFKSGMEPKFAYFEAGTGDEIELTLNTIGGDSVSDGTTFTYTDLYNQYGVRWNGDVNLNNFAETGTPYISTTEKGSAITGDVANDIKYDEETGKVVANANLQVSASNTNGKYEAYLVQKFKSNLANGGTKESVASAKIIVNYPKYTVTVDGAGSVAGLNYNLGLANGSTNTIWKQEGPYGTSLVNAPNGQATAKDENGNDTYTFKGLWTNKQPSTGKASYNELESDFATPISNDKFTEYKDDGGTVDGNYITYKEELYYNAGVQWDPKEKTITNNATYYGWWLSKDLTVKFYDIDGAYLGTKNVKYGQNQSDITWPTPKKESYVSGAYTYNNFTGNWIDINGDAISQNGCTFTRDLILTPEYEVKYTHEGNMYTVSFINEANGSNLTGSAKYPYRTDLSDPNVIPAAPQAIPAGIRNDIQYSYTLEGWSAQKPSSGNYHILLEDGNFDTTGTAIAINSDWIVRNDVTYYRVYRRHLRTYAVEFSFKDSTGTEISRKVNLKYGETLTPPTDYVPYTYAQEGYGYEFENWEYIDASSKKATLGYKNTLVFTTENLTIGLGAVEDGTENVAPVRIRAAYKGLGGVDYNVTFNYKNEKGETQTTTAEVKHGEFVLQDTVEALKPAAEYDDGEAMVHFTGNWKLVAGAGKSDGLGVAEGSDVATANLIKFSPISHVTFEAVYGNPEPFYNVTYIDGANKFEQRVKVGLNLPVWTTKVINDNDTPDDTTDDFEEEIEYLPKMADTAQGSYTFAGWYDEKQIAADYSATNGRKYEKTDIVEGNLTLYPQFIFSPFTYEIKFMDYEDKLVLAEGEFEYGESLEALIEEAVEKAQARAEDNTYTYKFIGWDKPVPTFCEGKDAKFIAKYQPTYKYYNVKWYNSVAVDYDNGVVTKWGPDKATTTEDDKTIETGLLTTTKHTYNSKLNAPSVKAECKVAAPEGRSYVFNGWYYNDSEGNPQPYVRGMAITGAMEFYATYKITDKVYTVTTDVKGETEEYKVAANEKATAVPTPNAGYVDAVNHDEFAGWVTKDENGTEIPFDIANTAITENITIYAKFTESKHNYDGEELVKAPTYYAKGEKKVWCSCDAKSTAKTAEIDMLTDTVKPTGTIYLGTQGSWSSTDEVGAAATDSDDVVTLYANANTDIILTVNDTGDVNELYNPSGTGKGIQVIQGFISKGVYSQDNQNVEMSEVVKIFEDTTEDLNNTANYVIKLGEYGDLEDGATYVAYYYVRDKAGNVLNEKVRTARFIYDDTDPEFTVVGDTNADSITGGTPVYCRKATVTGIEVGATLTVNGKPATLTTTSAAGTGTYVITEAGNYFITVTDKAGNKKSQKFQVNDDHSYSVTEVLSTCTTDGYKTEVCIVCGDEKDKEIYTATGHVTTPVAYEATCLENGYILTECSQCDYSVKTEFEVDENGDFVLDENSEKIPLFPALGHDYDMVDGEIVYTVVTEATCKTTGKKVATCKACGETDTVVIPVNEDAHNWGAYKTTLAATCTEDGKKVRTCKLCLKPDTEGAVVIPATGHVETQWVETTAATCGEAGVETLQCKKCKAYVDGDDADTEIDTREIPATGRHILAVSEDPTKTYDATADMEGQITRYCTQCGQEWVEKVDKIKKYTVKFVDEDGETEIKTITEVVDGTTIEKTDVTEPTKANSDDGKYRYTFAGWKDASGNAVTLPFDVTADITLKATYTQATIIYTHEFLVPNTWTATLNADETTYDQFAVMMGAMGDSRAPVAEPVFKHINDATDAELKKLYNFKFLGWSTTGAKGDIVTDFTIAGDATFKAVFEAEAISYKVIYYNGTDLVWNTTVEGGTKVTFGGTLPTKASDGAKHYTFDKWYTDATLKTEFNADTAITADTRLYAGFTGADHAWNIDVDSEENKAANCTEDAVVAYKCSVCNATKTETQKDTALDHTPAAAVEETVDNVKYSVVYCSVCGTEISRTKTSVTVAFKNHNGVRLDTQTLNVGDAIVYGGKTPTKAADEQFTYTFAGWYVEGDTTNTLVTLGNATADIVYVAEFTSATRTFRVSYVDINEKVLQTETGIKYGGTVPAYTGAEPTKKYDDKYHYEFDKWSVEAGATVTSELVIRPVFTAIEHEYDEGVEAEATCEKAGGYRYTCDCGHYYTRGTIPKLPHTFEEVDRKEPDYKNNVDGFIKYECSVCGASDEKTLESDLIEVKVEVKDTNDAARGGVKVELYIYGTNTCVGTQTTDGSGIAKFYVAPGSYTAKVEGKQTNITVDTDRVVTGGKVEVEPKPEEQAPSCSCTCHKTSFWGVLFRLFHKIIKLFTGKYVCCKDPSHLY